MLTDSKVRQAGFIRNSSSRKILYNPEPGKNRSDDSDDSFSSFQYQSGRYGEIEKSKDIRNSREKRQQQVNMKIMKPPSPHIPPRPSKKPQQKPQFQNERLKNNFFQQPVQQPKSRQKPQQIPQPFTLPRSLTPHFQQTHFKHQIQEVQNICNRIGNMKVLEGNFSFNPQSNKLKKEMKGQEYLSKNNIERMSKQEKKPKVNSYFNDDKQSNKFQYDFQSSDEDKEQEQEQKENQSECQSGSEQEDNEMIQHYQDQLLKKTLPQVAIKTQPKLNYPQTSSPAYSQGQIHHPQQQRSHPHQEFQNEESEDQQQQEELITDYNKTDFGLTMPEQMRRNKQTAQSKQQHGAQQQQGVIQKHGGISFQVDVRQFSHTPSGASYQQSTRRPSHQRKKKVNQKDELLKRRQMAKIYSKQARFRLFGFS